MNAIIIDDELHSRETTKMMLEQVAKDITILAMVDNAIKGATLVNELNPDLIFLDIQMPQITGIQMLDMIPTYEGEIIFITAHDRYAIDAFKKGAIHYLLKPLDPEELIDAVLRVRKNKKNNVIPSSGNWLSLSTMEGWIVIKKDDIIRCESYKNYTTITTTITKHTISKTMKDVEAKLPKNQFYRIHHSHIVNIAYIDRILKTDGGNVLLRNTDLIPISKNKKQGFFEWFQDHVESI